MEATNNLAPFGECDPQAFDDWLDEAAPSPTAAPAQELARRKALISAPAADAPPLAAEPPMAAPAAPMRRADVAPLGHLPEIAIRSALFGCGRPGFGFRGERERIDIQGDARLAASGPVLSMADRSIWEIALDMAKANRRGLSADFDAPQREFASRLGLKSGGGASCRLIRESLLRLANVRVEFAAFGVEGAGRLIAELDFSGGATRARLDAVLVAPLLTAGRHFRVDSRRRSGLRQTLARWLHDFVSTHAAPMAHDFRYLRALSGFPGEPREFPRALASALRELTSMAGSPEPERAERADACGAPLVESFSVDRGSRLSDDWTLSYVRGPEAPKFWIPPKSRLASSRSRRGGVAL